MYMSRVVFVHSSFPVGQAKTLIYLLHAKHHINRRKFKHNIGGSLEGLSFAHFSRMYVKLIRSFEEYPYK